MQAACWGVRMGAIPYHRERGSDPAGAGRQALREALEYAVSMGYSATTVDLGMRGRALCDPEVDQVDYCHFSAKAAAAYVALGELAKSEGIYHELRRLYTLPRVHMTTSYGLAMLHTRFHKKRDHDLAKSLQNNAIALAGQEQDPVKRAYLEVFHSNGLALIEMHRGDLKRALDLVTAGLERLDREVPADRYIVHRTQLLHNRARVLSALGRLDEAYVAFSTLIEVDRYFPEYHSDRANISRKRGDLLAALADYDQAIEVAPPFAELHYNRGDVRALIGDLPGAVADFEYAVELEPDYLDARVNLACLLLQAGNAPRACRVARAGLAGGNDEPRLLCILGRALQELDEPIAARQAFDRALSVAPDFVPALADRAMLAYGSGDIESAVADLDRALERGGENPDLLYNRGFAYHEMGRYADAVNDFTRALELPGVDRAELTHRRELSRRALAATAA
jgi:tetratricopeptide (TPR) repeat protein